MTTCPMFIAYGPNQFIIICHCNYITYPPLFVKSLLRCHKWILILMGMIIVHCQIVKIRFYCSSSKRTGIIMVVLPFFICWGEVYSISFLILYILLDCRIGNRECNLGMIMTAHQTVATLLDEWTKGTFLMMLRVK